MAALNFPSSPTDGQKWVDPQGQSWVYETTTNSWTAEGAPAPGMVYKGGIDITAAPPTGAQAGWVYTVTTGGTANAGFTGLTGTLAVGTQIIYDGAQWQEQGVDLWTRTGTTLSPATAGDDVFTTGAVKVGGTTAAPNIQVKADGGIVANTDGLVYDAANKRLGVGTTSPAKALHVNGDIRLPTDHTISWSDDACRIFKATNDLRIDVGSYERARIDASGRLLVGTPTARSNFFNTTYTPLVQIEGANSSDNRSFSFVYGASSEAGPHLILAKHRSDSVGGIDIVNPEDQLGEINFQGSGGTEFIPAATIAAEVDGAPSADMPGRLVFGTTPVGATSPTERMRIGNDGGFYFNTASRVDTCAVTIKHPSIATRWGIGPNNANNVFYVLNDSVVGVYLTSGGTSWSAQSDERLKTNLSPITNGLEKVASLRAVTGRYIADEESVSRSFLIAQDVQAVLPEAVDVQDDELSTLGLRYAEVVPLLVAALKESKERIEALEAEVQALKAS